MSSVIRGSDLWTPPTDAPRDAGWLVAVLQGSAEAQAGGQAHDLPTCSISFWDSELQSVCGRECLALVAPMQREGQCSLPYGETGLLDPLSCEVLLEVFVRNVRSPEHQTAALDLVCHQLAAEMSPAPSAVSAGALKQPTAETDDEALVVQIERYLEHHLDEPLSLSLLAQSFGCSASRISSAFRRAGRASPMKALAALRLRRAQDLLQSGDTPIMQIAQAVGYGDQASFTHFFRRHAGVSPREFRENHRWLL